MPELQLAQNAQNWINVVLIWVGFGTLAGLLARVVLPVEEPRGAIPTLLLGIVGSVVGLFALSLFLSDGQLNPISPLGFLAATACAFCLLIFYRLVYACIPKGKKGR